ncbi:MAG: hypothetical protein ACWGNV_16410 [Bacteroidales bacterium]
MKKKICLQLAVLMLLAGVSVTCSRDSAKEPPLKEKIVFNSSPELFELTSEWAGVYCTLNPEVEIDVVKASESTISETLNDSPRLSFVTSDFEPEIKGRSLWNVTVGRDIIVPVINARNPFIKEISNQGISQAGLARILTNPENTRWRTLIEKGSDVPVRFYTTKDMILHQRIARFLETDQLSFGEELTRDPESLVALVQSDEYALGICYLVDMIDPKDQNLYEDIRIMPIDKNGNGYIDYKEDVYSSIDAFARGVWIGKYPKKLANNIYSVSQAPPAKKSEQAFLSWVISRGYVLLDNHGFGNLSEVERLAQVKIIDGIGDSRPGGGTPTLPKEPGIFINPIPYALALMLLLTLVMYYILRGQTRKFERISLEGAGPDNADGDEDQVKVSPGLYYDRTHTWAFMEKDGTVKVGIDDFLQRVTGPLTRVKMKYPGERVKKGKKAVSIVQNGKQLDICAPVTGWIKELNSELTTDPSLLNSAPYSEGWIYKVEPSNWFRETQFLIMGHPYKLWLQKEYERLKDFLADVLRTENAGLAQVLQDGGELKENILKDLGPEIWEDFQTNFMDVAS